ncbi:MAG: hypothetical protein H7Z15_13765 [Rhizobacter sp.]|nr:hypothetical protein [Rhizobacter sp.]
MNDSPKQTMGWSTMPQHVHHGAPCKLAKRSRFQQLTPLVCALAVGVAAAMPCAATEVEIVGTGTFKPLPSDRLAKLPQGAVFSQADLSSGAVSFRVRYEDSTPDADPDFYVGRYGRAIRAVQLTVGSTTIALPPENVELVVSDGGFGFPDRESVRVKSWLATAAGVVRFSWVQSNQAPDRKDLRGAPGSLSGDALPEHSVLANLATSSRFDKFIVLELSAPADVQPLVYVSSSQVSAVATTGHAK